MDITASGILDQIKLPNAQPVSGTGNGSTSFSEIFRNAVDAANETDARAKADELAVATGESDDLHTLMINVAKADLALQTLVQLRNKALDAYNEIMRITL